MWDHERSFGFITPNDPATTVGDVFCHVSALPEERLCNVATHR